MVGLDDDDIGDIVNTIAAKPLSGDLLAGAGGARKLRHASLGKGKSGGIRTIHFYGGDDIPIFLLSVYGKSRKSNLTKAERNELAKLLPQIGQNYRKPKRS